jgi:HSP20 family protein
MSAMSFFERLAGSLKREPEVSVTGEEGAEEEVEVEQEEQEEREEKKTREGQVGEERGEQQEEEGQLTVDVYHDDEAVYITSTIAGVKPDDLDVTITNEMITIRGERRQPKEIPDDCYYYRECYWGPFSRSIILPVDVVAEKAEAHLKDGILTIKIPKAESVKTQKIKVRGF